VIISVDLAYMSDGQTAQSLYFAKITEKSAFSTWNAQYWLLAHQRMALC